MLLRNQPPCTPGLSPLYWVVWGQPASLGLGGEADARFWRLQKGGEEQPGPLPKQSLHTAACDSQAQGTVGKGVPKATPGPPSTSGLLSPLCYRDLKRDVAKKLEKLEKRTQRAIAELIRKCRAWQGGSSALRVVPKPGAPLDPSCLPSIQVRG